jgi:hypothetical protein
MDHESRSNLSSAPPNPGPTAPQHFSEHLGTRKREQYGFRREERRESLLCELLFAAKDLAHSQLRYIPADPFVHRDGLTCMECHAVQRRGLGIDDELRIEHAPFCRTGRVAAILVQLTALAETWPEPAEVRPFFYRQEKATRARNESGCQCAVPNCVHMGLCEHVYDLADYSVGGCRQRLCLDCARHAVTYCRTYGSVLLTRRDEKSPWVALVDKTTESSFTGGAA